MRLTNKVAIVTGAGSGFGEGIARLFAKEGAKVVIADIDLMAAKRVEEALGDQAFAHSCDVSSARDWQKLVTTSQEKFGDVDILINNAGFSHSNKPIQDVTEQEFDRIFAVNVKSIYLSMQCLLPLFEKKGSGVVLNIASTAGVRPRPNLTWYNASKGAVITATKSLAVELAPKKIRVNAINPVLGETGMTHLFMGEDTPERRKQFLSTIPLGRMSTAKDIANAALFLCSDEAEFITGVAMEVDGGRCI